MASAVPMGTEPRRRPLVLISGSIHRAAQPGTLVFRFSAQRRHGRRIMMRSLLLNSIPAARILTRDLLAGTDSRRRVYAASRRLVKFRTLLLPRPLPPDY